jgi:hypothetical protein
MATSIPASGGGGQDPSNVNITGGSIVGVNTATRSVQGAESAADKAYFDDFNAFKKRVYAVMVADIPGLTGFKGYDLLGANLASAAAAAATNDGFVEGGGLSVPNGSGAWTFGATVFQNVPGGNWAIGWRAKFASPAGAGELAQVGIASTDNANFVVAGTRNSISSTQWSMRFVKAAATTDAVGGTPDTAWHDIVITDDGTTVRMRVDGVVVCSQTTRTNLNSVHYAPVILNDTLQNLQVAAMAIGYMAP